MIQSWNKFCFTGGILEVNASLPGKPDVGGLWPAIWLLGNLGRATFMTSTNRLWPWSQPKCNPDLREAQEINGCDNIYHYGLNEGQGRGATEIDLLEAMPGTDDPLPIVKNNVTRPYNSMTLQIAPGISSSKIYEGRDKNGNKVMKSRPFPGTLPEWGYEWYSNLTYGTNSSINPYFYGTYLGPTSSAEIGKYKILMIYYFFLFFSLFFSFFLIFFTISSSSLFKTVLSI